MSPGAAPAAHTTGAWGSGCFKRMRSEEADERPELTLLKKANQVCSGIAWAWRCSARSRLSRRCSPVCYAGKQSTAAC